MFNSLLNIAFADNITLGTLELKIIVTPPPPKKKKKNVPLKIVDWDTLPLLEGNPRSDTVESIFFIVSTYYMIILLYGSSGLKDKLP